MKLLVDGVFFQMAATGIGRVWISLLSELVQSKDLSIAMLDRGNAPEIPGITRIAFPSYTMTYTAADSLLIQNFCDKIGADIFTSTYYTTAVSTPQVQMVYDMIPEVLGFDLSARAWKEKQIALSYASHLACISEQTRNDLRRHYPRIPMSRSKVTYCGVDRGVFNKRTVDSLDSFRHEYDVHRPYFLFVGSREQHRGYKNAKLFFDTVGMDETADFDILCVGGEPVIEPQWTRQLPRRVNVKRLDLDDQELAAAYAGAIALVYPSLYEGFGMPVVEAMASGCPVITTHHGSLAEVAGDAALIISGHDRHELLRALQKIREPERRRKLIEDGFKQAAKFRWDETAHAFYDLLKLATSTRSDEREVEFHRQWRRLRTIQAEVDVGLD